VATTTRDDKVKAIVEQLRAIVTRQEQLLADLDAVLAAEPTPGQNAKRLLDFFCKHWEKKFNEKYIVNGAKDMKMLKRLLSQLQADEIARRIRVYFNTTDDEFFTSSRFALSVFVSSINRIGVAPDVPIDRFHCGHAPRCSSDAQHTRRILEEARRAQ
jgi:hypothetical protein